MNRQLLIYAAIIFTVTMGYLGISMHEAIWVPNRLPYFELEQLDHPQKKMSRKSLSGRWVLLNFWASWCEVCDQEAPVLNAFQSDSVDVVGVVTRDSLQAVLASEKASVRGPKHMLDENGDLFTALGFDGLPASILLNPEGEIVMRIEQPLRPKILSQVLQRSGGS